MFKFRLLVFLFLPILSYGQSDTEKTELVLNSRWDVQHAGCDDNGTYFFISRLAETNHLFLWQPEVSVLQQVRICCKKAEKAVWTKTGALIVACDGKMFQLGEKHIKQLIPDRDVVAFDPLLNHNGNLLLFRGQRPNQQEMSLFTYDFIYDNLNQLEGTERYEHASWSPSDELIVSSSVENDKHVLKLLHWYDKPFDTIRSDTLDLMQAVWSESDFRLFAMASGKKQHYLIAMRKDGSNADIIWQSDQPFKILNFQAEQRKILALQEMEDKRNQLITITIDRYFY